MTDPVTVADLAWKDAEALVERVERTARSNVAPGLFFEDLTSGMRQASGASAVALWAVENQQKSILARVGIAIHSDEVAEYVDQAADYSPRSQWIDGCGQAACRLIAAQRVAPDAQLGLDIRFDRQTNITLRQPLSELAEAVLELAVPVFLRSRLIDLRSRLHDQSHRDALISKFNEGIALTDCFASIAAAVACETQVDRVSLLRLRSGRYRLITTSTQTKIDRRARQVRLLERLTEAALREANRFSFVVGSPDELSTDSCEELEGYLHESGCREIHIESIERDERVDSIAAIVLERFRAPSENGQPISSLLGPIVEPVSDAVRGALHRDDAAWGLIASRFAAETSRRKTLFFTAVICVLVVASCLIPTSLKIPLEGRLLAAKRSRLFAPADGIVADVPVVNGQQVHQGETLVILRSPKLDLQQRQIEGSLATARTRLDSLLALRSRGSSLPGRERESNVSADEQSLKTEIEGLEKQLHIVEVQQTELTITSPIDGRVDRWDLQQSLTARPVTHGQHLLEVISAAEGWTVELDLPEYNVNYVLDEQRRNPCRCTFRLRSDPTVTYEGIVTTVADVAHINPQGESMVRVTLTLKPDSPSDFRTGATVMAQIHCGTRSIGFVWLRGLIQWYRSQPWI